MRNRRKRDIYEGERGEHIGGVEGKEREREGNGEK